MALAHLIANDTPADLLLFGGFAGSAALCFRAARRRDRAQGTRYAAGTALGTVMTVVVVVAAGAAFAFWAHERCMGVRPFG